MQRLLPALLIALLLGTFWLLWRDPSAGEAGPPAGSGAGAPAGAAGPAPGPAPPAPEPGRESLPVAAPEDGEAGEADGWIFRGVVRSAQDGAPLPGARMTFQSGALMPLDGAFAFSARAGEDGAFAVEATAFQGLVRSWPDGVWMAVRVWAPRHLPLELQLTPRDFASGVAEREVVLQPGATVHGRVVDAGGRPVQGAHLMLQREEQPVGAQTTSAEDGFFAVPFQTPGKWRLLAWADGHGGAALDPLDLDTTGDRDVGDLVLEGTGVLAGRVVDRDGQPLPDLEVRADLVGRGQDWLGRPLRTEAVRGGLGHGEAVTGADGRFRFGGLKEGLWEVRLGSAALFFTRGAADSEPVRAETGTLDLEIVYPGFRLDVSWEDRSGLSPVPVDLRVRRLDPARPDAGGLHVASQRLPATAGQTFFWLDDPGTFEVQASAPQRRQASARVILAEAPRASAHLVLEAEAPPGLLRVRIVDASGQPVPGSRVGARRLGSRRLVWPGGWVEPAEDGLLPPLAAGRWQLEVLPGPATPDPAENWWMPVRGEEVEVLPGDTVEKTVVVHQGGRLRVTFEAPPEALGQPLRNLSLLLRPLDGRGTVRSLRNLRRPDTRRPWAPWSNLPEEPAWCMDLLPPGAHELRADARGFQTATVPVDLRPGEWTEVLVPLYSR